MKMRLMGTREEIATVVQAVTTVLDVQGVSDWYANRGTSRLGRVYVEIGGVRPVPPLRATATRVRPPLPGVDPTSIEGTDRE
jgi:hypothetical protein